MVIGDNPVETVCRNTVGSVSRIGIVALACFEQDASGIEEWNVLKCWIAKYPFSLKIMSGGIEHNLVPDNARTGSYDSVQISGFRANELSLADK